MMTTPPPAQRLVIVGLLCLAIPILTTAQSTGALRGTITDRQGEPLPGVIIEVSGTRDGIPGRGAVSGASGAFHIPSLPPGRAYEVKATFPDYATVILSEVEVSAARVTNLKIVMQPAEELSEQVEVRAQPQIVDLETTATETRFSSEFVDALPILGRNYQDVLKLAPGVTDVDGDGNPNIHGARDTDVGTLVDGISTTDPLTGKLGAQLNIESIQEIEIKTSGATTEFGRAQGGFANIITKSGGNDFEGTFKMFWRGSALDGDGAGISDPQLHAGLGERGLRKLEFNDFMPFLSVSGPIVRDKAWFFVALEYIQIEKPVNAVSAAFVTGIREHRDFAKATWQANQNNRLAFLVNHDPQELLNQGLNSFTRSETGFTVKQGGLFLSLKDMAILSPTVALETTIAHFDGNPDRAPNLGPDVNGNGFLYRDLNANGFFEASERDHGEDYDGDGAYDVWEDTLDDNGKLDEQEWKICLDANGNTVVTRGKCYGPPSEILLDEDGIRSEYERPFHPGGDGDLRLTPPGGCEGILREDVDCDGFLDQINEDLRYCFNALDPRCLNGRLDEGEDIDSDGRLDLGTEDRNGNHILDDRPFPSQLVRDGDGRPLFGMTALYPYGRLSPEPADRDYTVNQLTGVVSGPFFETFHDDRQRFTLRQDLSIFVPEFHGSHDMKIGYVLERETFDRQTNAEDIVAPMVPAYNRGRQLEKFLNPNVVFHCNPYEEPCIPPDDARIVALLPLEHSLNQGTSGNTIGLFAQDTYKPRPNVSIGFGVRFEREVAHAAGYSYFDPGAERTRFDRLNALAGSESTGSGALLGNADGIKSFGFLTDPLFAETSADSNHGKNQLGETLRLAAIGRLTRHRSDLTFTLNELESLYPDILQEGELNPDRLAELGIRVQRPEIFSITNNNLAPRLSMSWDPWCDGRTKLFATWGRYYDKLFQTTVIGEQSPERLQRYYVFDRSGVNVHQDSQGHVTGGLPTHNIGQLISKAPPSVTQVDRALGTPFSDELTIGFEREIAPEVAFSVRYIDRHFRDQLQDIDVNHEVRRDSVSGQLSDSFGIRLNDPNVQAGGARTRSPDGRPDLFINNFFFNQVLRIGNFNEARYKAIEVEALKRLSRRWQMQVSYTYSRAVGAAEDFQARLGNDPSTVESEFGALDYDQRHVVKLNATTFLPRDWQLGIVASWASGLPYSIVSRFFALDDVDYAQFRTRYGFTAAGGEFEQVRRNSERNASIYDFNLRVKKSVVIGRTSAAMFVEIFNILNSDDLRLFAFAPNQGSAAGTSDVPLVPGALQLDAERRFGRRFQVGAQFNF